MGFFKPDVIQKDAKTKKKVKSKQISVKTS